MRSHIVHVISRNFVGAESARTRMMNARVRECVCVYSTIDFGRVRAVLCEQHMCAGGRACTTVAEWHGIMFIIRLALPK